MSWQQAINIWREARGEIISEQARPPVACPNDGEPLRRGPGHVLFCPFDGWQWPRDERL